MSEQDESRGRGWFAIAPAGYRDGEDDDAFGPVTGMWIRFMCDYGVTMPLWDEHGLVPRTPTGSNANSASATG